MLLGIHSRSQGQLDQCILKVQFKFHQNRIISTRDIAVSRQDLFFEIDFFTQAAITFFQRYRRTSTFSHAKRYITANCSRKLEKIGQGVQELCPFEVYCSKKNDTRSDFQGHSQTKNNFKVPISGIVPKINKLVSLKFLGTYLNDNQSKIDLKVEKNEPKNAPKFDHFDFERVQLPKYLSTCHQIWCAFSQI